MANSDELTMGVVLKALREPDSADTPRAERLLALLISNLEQKELLDRSEIDEMVEMLRGESLGRTRAAKQPDAQGRALLNLANWAERLEGQAYADRVIQDALVTTVLQSAPQLAGTLTQNLQARYDRMPGSMRGEPLKRFQQRIDEMRNLIDGSKP